MASPRNRGQARPATDTFTDSVGKAETKNENRCVAALFSFFSGFGFLDLGFEYSDFPITFVNEIHKPFLTAYKHARENLRIPPPAFGYYTGSITDFTGSRLRTLIDQMRAVRAESRLVGFIAGPPCPDFSVGGKNKGVTGDTGKLSSAYFDLICASKPDFFLFENVDGLLRTKKHRAYYDSMKALLSEAGFHLSEKIVNCISFNVPQDRRRVFLFGIRKSLVANFKGLNWNKYMVHPENSAFAFSWPNVTPFEEDSELPPPADIPLSLTVQHWFEKNKVVSHPNAEHQFCPRAGLAKFLSIFEGDDSRKSYKRLHRWRFSPAAAYGNNEVHLHPYKARRISVSEALAVQSLPASFELPSSISLTNMFKGTGNGVPYLAARGIAQTIHEFIRENPR